MFEISAEEVKAKLDAGDPLALLDVREPPEVAICTLPDAEHIPMMQLFTGMQKPAADPAHEIVVYCHTGIRSFEAAAFLRGQGFANAKSLAGGIDAWAATIDPSMARY